MAAEPPALRLRPPGSAGDSPPVPRLLGGCVPLSHQVAGHMYGKDKVGECSLGSPSPVSSVPCPGNPRPPLYPAPAVLGLRRLQLRWSSVLGCRHPDSHRPPLSPPCSPRPPDRGLSCPHPGSPQPPIPISAIQGSSIPYPAVPGLRCFRPRLSITSSPQLPPSQASRPRGSEAGSPLERPQAPGGAERRAPSSQGRRVLIGEGVVSKNKELGFLVWTGK